MADDIRTWLQSATSDEDRPAIPAATVVLLRDTPQGLQTLMVKKASKIAFGGMWVFPGGRIEDDDHDGGPELDAAARAAVREAEEECGLCVDPTTIVPFSFWLPPKEAPRRFATWFFLGAAPEGTVVIDGGEIRDHQWCRPAELLTRRDHSDVELAPPTWVTLWHLARFDDVDSAIAHARASTPERYETRVAKVDGTLAALWAGDVGYEGGDAEVDGPRHRLVMLDGPWRYERSG